MKFKELTEIRDVDVLGESNWYWTKEDQGAFGNYSDGPMRDWIDSHSDKYFKYLKNTGTLITAGTSCGMYARLFSKKFEHIYAFEPDPLSFYCMVNNVQEEHVHKFNAALGNRCGVSRLNLANKVNVGMNSISEEGLDIAILSIDSLNVPELDLIQLDVEGYEFNVLEGGRRTIEKFKPVIIAECFSDETHKEYMRNLGYSYMENSFSDAIYIPMERI